MEAVSLGLGTVDLCITYGTKLYAICQAYKNADSETRQSVLRIESVWLKSKDQVEALRSMWDQLDEHVQIHQNNVLSLLQDKLQLAVTIVDGLETVPSDEPSLRTITATTRGDLKRFKYAVRTKTKLDKIVKDLEEWHTRFDPSWYLLARMASPVVEQQATPKPSNSSKEISIIRELHKAHRMNNEASDGKGSVFLSNQISIYARTPISHAYAEAGLAGEAMVILDSLRVPEGNDIRTATKDVRDLARVLVNVDSVTFGLLACQGVMKVHDSENGGIRGFDFMLKCPSGFESPRSLRNLLLTPGAGICLDDRFRIARSLARSVLFLHSCHIVHKNISPETIIVLNDSSNNLPTPFLVGFEKFRRAGDRTYMTGDTDWDKNLYRHPKRQGEQPEEEYQMQHDIYSLGVCLLEIGLGDSLIRYENAAVSDANPRGAIPSPVLDIEEHLKNKDTRARAFQIKRMLVDIAMEQLPIKMGKVYTDVAISCLTCLDPNNEGFGDESEFLDEDGILVGIRYIEKVLHKFEEIKV